MIVLVHSQRGQPTIPQDQVLFKVHTYISDRLFFFSVAQNVTKADYFKTFFQKHLIHEPIFTSLFSQQYYSRLALNFQAGAHLRVTSANGLTPVMDRVGGRDRKPVTTLSRQLITLQTQVILVAYRLIE